MNSSCPPRPSGSMPPEREQTRPDIGGMIRMGHVVMQMSMTRHQNELTNLIGRITTVMTDMLKQHLLAGLNPMGSDFMICWVMSGSGARIGMGIMHPVLLPILKVHRAARTGSFAVAVGTTNRGTVARPIATGTILTTATTTWASAS